MNDKEKQLYENKINNLIKDNEILQSNLEFQINQSKNDKENLNALHTN